MKAFARLVLGGGGSTGGNGESKVRTHFTIGIYLGGIDMILLYFYIYYIILHYTTPYCIL